uniref:Uncharacterized protein n=1 Tax=Graphocephala atropunctata TaxID=36148 RepID=A0A1B6LN83_9HEMI
MLFSRWSPFIVAAGLLCHVSAFSTRFVVEEVGGPQVKGETTELKKEENNTVENQSTQTVEVKVIPIMTDSFIQTEDLLSMTPLKLVTAISAEHLLNAVRNIPLKGNSAQDILEMLGGVVKEINRTATIIKLTAEYVNVSSHYMMSALEQLNESNCEQDVLEESVKSLRKNFYKSIAEHVAASVKELFEKTREREMTGNDILISSAYHIVTSFQEMTTEVVSLTKEAYKKCSSPRPSLEIFSTNVEQSNTSHIKPKDEIAVEVVPGQGKVHKSIKKDQATTKPEITATVDSQNNQDLTIEVFPPEVLMQNPGNGISKNQEKPIQYLKVAHVPLLKTVSLFSNSGNEDVNERAHKEQEFGGATRQEMKKTENVHKELASSAVDSLSNVPWESSETVGNNLDKTFVIPEMEKSPQNLWNMLQLLAPNYKQLSISQCDDNVVPVCGIDEGIQRFIIFVNDCKRVAYNKLYRTSYNKSNMETCLQFFLRNQQETLGDQKNQTNNVDLRPR